MEGRDNRYLFHTLNQRVRLLNKKINDRLYDHGLYHSQWSILFCLNRFGPMTQTAIWQYLNVEAPTITRTLSRMEKSGWIVREKGKDKRERIISLTETAKKKFSEVEKAVERVEQEMVKHLSLEEQKQLQQLLEKFGSEGEDSNE